MYSRVHVHQKVISPKDQNLSDSTIHLCTSTFIRLFIISKSFTLSSKMVPNSSSGRETRRDDVMFSIKPALATKGEPAWDIGDKYVTCDGITCGVAKRGLRGVGSVA